MVEVIFLEGFGGVDVIEKYYPESEHLSQICDRQPSLWEFWWWVGTYLPVSPHVRGQFMSLMVETAWVFLHSINQI